MVQALSGAYAFCGLALQRDGGEPQFHMAAAGRRVDTDTLFRVASVSKVITGQTALAVLGQEAATIAAETVLGFPLRHPLTPDAPVTIGQIAAHHAGLCDAGGYILPEGQTIADWFAEMGDAVWDLPSPPGTRFIYCNLGYILLAAIAEIAAGERFDDLASRLALDPLGVRTACRHFDAPSMGSIRRST